jgi:hypothetical protein
MTDKTTLLKWKVHVNDLFVEIAEHTQGGTCVAVSLHILQELLIEVAERAIKLNDPELNKLMIRMSLYSISNPHDKEYNPKLVSEILGESPV